MNGNPSGTGGIGQGAPTTSPSFFGLSSASTGSFSTGGIFGTSTGSSVFGQTTPAISGGQGGFGASSSGPSVGGQGSFSGFGSSFSSGGGGGIFGSSGAFGGFGQGSGSGFQLSSSSGTPTNFLSASNPFSTQPSTSNAPSPTPLSFGTSQTGAGVFSNSGQSGGIFSSTFGSSTSTFGAASGTSFTGFGTANPQQGTGTLFTLPQASTPTLISGLGQSTGTMFGTGSTVSNPFSTSQQGSSAFTNQSFGVVPSGFSSAPSTVQSTFATGSGTIIGGQQTTPAVFSTATSSSTTAPFSFSSASNAGTFLPIGGLFPTVSNTTMNTLSSAPPASPSTGSFTNPFQAGSAQMPTHVATGPVRSGVFPNLSQSQPAPVSPAVSEAAAVPIPDTTTTAPPTASVSTSPTARPQSTTEIQPDSTQAPGTRTPSAPTTTQSNSVSMRATPNTTAPTVSSTMAVSASQPAVPASSAPVQPATSNAMEIGAVLHEAIPVARQMEDDFHFISERLAERDLAIVKRGEMIAELMKEYEQLMARQRYCDKEMLRLETQIKNTQQHAKAIIESFEKYSGFSADGVALKASFDQMYDGLIEIDAFYTEMETIVDGIYEERIQHFEEDCPKNGPSPLEVERLLLELRSIENRRKKIEEWINSG